MISTQNCHIWIVHSQLWQVYWHLTLCRQSFPLHLPSPNISIIMYTFMSVCVCMHLCIYVLLYIPIIGLIGCLCIDTFIKRYAYTEPYIFIRHCVHRIWWDLCMIHNISNTRLNQLESCYLPHRIRYLIWYQSWYTKK